MKKQLLALTVGIGAIVATPFVAAETLRSTVDTTAVRPTTDAMVRGNQSAPIAVSKVLQSLEAQGYVAVRDVELDNGVYKADVISTDGAKQDIEVNAMSGAIKGHKNPPNHFSAIDIAKKVEDAGYQITKMESDGDTYKVKSLDRDGKKTSLKVNAMTGDITKKWFN